MDLNGPDLNGLPNRLGIRLLRVIAGLPGRVRAWIARAIQREFDRRDRDGN